MHDAIIIGGGHNGLVCAAYLARAGLDVVVLERRDILGGAAVTEEFAPGFRNSTASYTVSLLNPKIIRDLELARHGLRIVERPVSNYLPSPGERGLTVGGGPDATRRAIAERSPADAERLPRFMAVLDAVAEQLRALLLVTPPAPGRGLGDYVRALSVGRQLRRLGTEERRDVLELFTRSAGDLLDYWFENNLVRAAFGFDAVVGNYASPYEPGSAYVLLHHAFGEVNGKRGAWGHALGGMGAISDAIAADAASHGAKLRTNAAVGRVLAQHGEVTGVALADGTEIRARTVVSAINPKLLFLKLIERDQLPEDLVRRMERYRCGSATLRMNVALSELPELPALGPGQHPEHASGIIIGPSLAYMDEAWRDARARGWSRRPVVELLIPSLLDPSLAPPGQHVASLFCQHFAPTLPEGRSWSDVREQVADQVIAHVSEFSPNFSRAVVGRLVLTPQDLETRLGLVGGDIFHGALGLDQLFSARPVLGHGDYRGPLAGLYLSGAGTHPGGGVTGIPGHNTAREVLRDLRRRRWRKPPDGGPTTRPARA
jgi:phytoene dehydrogenase-like protein